MTDEECGIELSEQESMRSRANTVKGVMRIVDLLEPIAEDKCIEYLEVPERTARGN